MDQGKSIIFITHKLREVLAVADQIVVLRGGKVVGSADPKSATQQSLATLMVGRDVSFTIDKAPATPGEPVLDVSQLWVDDDRGVTTVADLDLEVRAGEVFGIAGVEGNGQRELVEALMGMRPKRSGGVVIAGRNVTDASPREIIELGVGHVPEDRGKHGVVGPFTHRRQPRAEPLPTSARSPAEASATTRPSSATRTTLVREFDVRTPEHRASRPPPSRAATSRR